MTVDTIHTIDARGNVMLEVVKEHFKLTDVQVGALISHAAESCVALLQSKGVAYADLRSALVPRTDKKEAVFLCDRKQIGSLWYARNIYEQIMPALASGRHSIRHGDLLGGSIRQSWIARAIKGHLMSSDNPFEWSYSNDIFAVYVNNLSDGRLAAIEQQLRPWCPYMGYVDATYSSQFKAYLSTILPAAFIVHDRTVIQSHEDDLPPETNQNTMGLPIAEVGLQCLSVPGDMYGLLLSYKIERPVVAGVETDTLFSLSAISDSPTDLDGFQMELDEKKFEYLVTEKSGTLKRLGILGAPSTILQNLVTGKLRSNYIYSLEYKEEFNVAKFNVVLELEAVDTGEPVRLTVALEYKANKRTVRLITLY